APSSIETHQTGRDSMKQADGTTGATPGSTDSQAERLHDTPLEQSIPGSENPQRNGHTPDAGEAAGAPQDALNGPDTIRIAPEAPAARLEAACPAAEAVQQQFLAFLAAGCPKGLHFLVTLKTGKKFQTWAWNGKPLSPPGAWY